MTKITAYNTLGTKESRVVASYTVDTTDTREAMKQARYNAARWNQDETRNNMRVNFVMCDGFVSTV